MRIALVQQTAGFDREKNTTRGLEALERAADGGADLVVFPELAFTRFFPQHRLSGDRFQHSEPIPGPTTDAFCAAAGRLGLTVVINLYERDGSEAYDSSPVIDADGSLLGVTRMMHITQYDGFWEQDYYTPGDRGAPVYETAAGRVGVAICYDRHYPEVMRSFGLQSADVVVVPQAGAMGEWPEGLQEAEMRVAAFQHGYFVALANRVGREDVLEFEGGSFVTDPFGRVIARAPEGKDALLISDLDLDRLGDSPARRLFLQHRRPGEYLEGSIDPARAVQSPSDGSL